MKKPAGDGGRLTIAAAATRWYLSSMTESEKADYRVTARANGMKHPVDWAALERYLAQDDEDAVIGLIWNVAEEEGYEEPAEES